MKKNFRITLIALLVILILLVLGGTIFAYVNKYAYADYSDITPNSVVNFNQLFNKTEDGSNISNITMLTSNSFKINNALTNGSMFQITQTQFVNGHKYYYFGNGNAFKLVDNNGDTIGWTPNNIYTSTKKLYYLNYNSIYGSYNIGDTYYFNIVDLSYMFGVGSEPDLATCQTIFTSDSYNYNTGTPMFFGRNDLNNVDSINYSLNTGNTKPMVPNNQSNASVSYVSNDYGSQLAFFTTIDANSPSDCIFIVDFGFTFTKGSIVTISAENYYLNGGMTLAYVNNVDYSLIYNIPTRYSSVGSFSYTFEVTEDFSAFYLLSFANSGSLTTPFARFSNFRISVQTADTLSALIAQAQAQTEQQIEAKYAEGGSGYNEIFNSGKQYAIQHNENNAWGSAWDFIESAFTGIGSIFAIELLPNVPLSVFILIPLMVGLIFFVVKVAKGGGS